MTSSVKVADLLGNIKTYAYNAAGMQRAAMAAYKAINDGTVDIVDATNPFVYAIEYSSVNAAAIMQNAAALTRRQYPAAATTFEELYLHMSDPDYANIFALPTQALFYLAISKQQLEDALVLDQDTGISKVTIPRNTKFLAAGTPFSLQYPIDIRKLEHGALQIVYDVSKPTALQNIDTNVIDYSTIYGLDGREYIRFAVETQQFQITSITNPFDATSGFYTTVAFNDQYYAARVYVSNTDGSWREIAVTYTDQVYDPLTPTAVLQVVNNKLAVRLPLVYITTGLISGKMRIDVYQTQGPMDLQLGNYAPDNFLAQFDYIDENDSSVYTSAFKTITDIAPFAQDATTGGRAALTFEQLQLRVIQSANGPRKIPITPSQIQATLLDLGYTLVKHVDTLTDRIYWATKALPIPNSASLVTSANAGVATIVTQVGQADSLQGCYNHTTGMTIGSKALVKNTNGVTALLTKAAYASLLALPLADRTSALNSGKYSYTLFHYVLDNTTDSFVVRPYYMDEPRIAARSFIQENPGTGLQASIGANFGVIKTDTGYRLTLTTKSNDAYKLLADAEVFCQLAMISPSQSAPGYMLGTQLTRDQATDERVFIFDISSFYDVDSTNALSLPSFNTSTAGFVPRCNLQQQFSVLFGTTNGAALQTPTTAIDQQLGTFQLSGAAIGITHEHLTLVFGYALDTLWNSYRSFASTIPYQTYQADVPMHYTTDQYAIDPITGSKLNVVNGAIQYNITHRAGDPVLDGNSHPVYLHKTGDLILDVFNRPIPVENYQTIVSRAVDLMTLDGVYQFANDPVTLAYVQQIKTSLLTSLTQDLVQLNAEALERTKIYYYPAITQGNVNVLADNNQQVNLEAAQSLKAVIYVDELVFNNKALTASIQAATVKTLSSYLAANNTVANSAMEKALAATYGSDVKEVVVSGLGGGANYRVLTVTDDSTKLSVRKVLKLLPNGQLAVQEDISVVFTIHGRNA